MNIPRWVAEILESEKHIILHEQDMVTELKQAKVKEDVQGEESISTLDKHFYIRMNSYIKKLSKDIIFVFFILFKTILASRDNNNGKVSPMGEAVAMLPAIVATFLICIDPYLLRISVKSG